MTAPDIVGVLRVDQGWGSAQVSGVAHQVHVSANDASSPAALPRPGTTGAGAFGAGVSFNLPMLGAADKFALQGDYTKNAIWYSGILDGMWGENGAVNGNGLCRPGRRHLLRRSERCRRSRFWSNPTAWSIGGTFEHHFSPVFSLDPQASYAQINWSNSHRSAFEQHLRA